MKRGVSRSHKSKVFNPINIILIALVLIEVAFVVNEGVLTGQPVRTTIDGDAGTTNLGTINSQIIFSQENYEIQLDVPDYLPESLRHPQKFFSGGEIRIVEKGNKNYFPSSVTLTKRDSTTKEILSKEIVGATKYKEDGEDYSRIKIPEEVNTGYYTVEFESGNDTFLLPIQIEGLNEIEKNQITSESNLKSTQTYSPEILRLFCGRCYWESVSGLNPYNENYGYLVGYVFVQTIDGWKSSKNFAGPSFHHGGDPKIAFDQRGRFILSHISGINIDTDAMNFPANLTRMVLNALGGADYPKISIDTSSISPYYGNIYVFSNLADLGPEYNPRLGQGIFIVNSTGNIFRKIRELNPKIIDTNMVVSSTIVGKNGEVFITGYGSAPILGVSFDGGKNYTYHNITQYRSDEHSCFVGARLSTSSNRSWFIYEGPELAIDDNGVLYVAWADFEKCVDDLNTQYRRYSYNYDVYVSKSNDSGVTWSQPVKVNDDYSGGDQGFPSIKVDENGEIYVVFLDHRDHQDLSQFDVYIAKSKDGGNTFSKNVKVNDISVPNIYGGRDPGDYLDMLSVGKTKVFVSHPCVNFNLSQSGTLNDACVARLPKSLDLKSACADIYQDKVINVLDVVALINYAFRGGSEPNPKWIGDLNGDGVVDIVDVVGLINHVFRGYPEPTCTTQQTATSSSGTISLGTATGTTTLKSIPVYLTNTENVAGTTFKVSYDANKLYIKNIRTSTRTGNMQLIRSGNSFSFIDQSGNNNIPKGSGAIAYIDVTTGKAGFDTSSLKITEAKAANQDAKKIAVSIGKTTTTKSGTSLS